MRYGGCLASGMSRTAGSRLRAARPLWAVALLGLAARAALATSVLPISDAELYRRADLVVYGIVISSDVTVDGLERPETLTLIEPLAVLKGTLSGSLALHQLGGELPDGRFWKMWGRPEYVPGREVVVFALARPQGEYETAEMMLGKFEVWADAAGGRFAVPELALQSEPGVQLLSPGVGAGPSWEDATRPRDLSSFLASLCAGAAAPSASAAPAGPLTPVRHADVESRNPRPEWGNINNARWRWNNNATASWSFNGTANVTGGGSAEANAALAAWTNDPFSSIHYTAGAGSNTIYLNAVSSVLGCGWSACLSGGGVIGCGGPSGGGSNTWRGEGYSTIFGGTVELRSYCAANAFDTITTQAVLTHELGHTLGLGHSDQNVSAHDVCRGDEVAAQMRSSVQHRTTLGTDDQDAIRWLYGDGGNSCTVLPAPTAASIAPATGSAAGGAAVTISGTNFAFGATVSLGGANAAVTALTATSITAVTEARAVGTVNVTVTNPDAQSATIPNAYFYDFADVAPTSAIHPFVLKLYRDGVTAGCSASAYCPNDSVTRAQMAVFLLRSEHGSAYAPPGATGTVFADVSATSFAAAWIERLYAEGITGGCATSPLRYCPTSAVTRGQMSVLLLRGEHGSAYVPPAAAGLFSDVPATDAQAPWIERLYAEGITGGCGTSPLRYCPASPATRGQMAVFLATTFHLP